MKPFYETRARRERLSAEYREQLLAELVARRIDATTASAQSLVTSAVSAHVQVAELSRQFERNRATPRAQQTLSLARSELRRCLCALGLIGDEREDDAVAEANLTPSEWLARQAGAGSES